MRDTIEILSPVKAVRKSEIIADKIKSLILEKTYACDEKLPSESELARMLSVSRASVREALRALELMGLIEVRSGSGAFVKKPGVFHDFCRLDKTGWMLILFLLREARRPVCAFHVPNSRDVGKTF